MKTDIFAGNKRERVVNRLGGVSDLIHLLDRLAVTELVGSDPLQQMGEAVPGEHHAPIRYLSRDANITVRQYSRIRDLPALSPFPFGVPRNAPFWYPIFTAISKLSSAQASGSVTASSEDPS